MLDQIIEEDISPTESIQESLHGDTNGGYKATLLSELDDAYAEIGKYVSSGLAPSEYQIYSKLLKAVASARKFINDSG